MPTCGRRWRQTRRSGDQPGLGGLETAKINGFGFENYEIQWQTMSDTVDAVFDPVDFSFVVKMRGGAEKPWIWEVHCAGKAKPVERSPVFYKSAALASKEGKRALARVLKAECASVGGTSDAA